MKQKTIFIAAIVILAVAFGAATQLYRGNQTEQATQVVTQNREALVRFHSPTTGNAEAPVHIVEFLDPACEGCAAFYPFVKDIMASHPGKIRLSVRYAPFHKGSEDVVKVLEATRKQGKYWQALEALFAAQSGWTEHHTARVELVWQYLAPLGLDVERLKTDMQSPEIARIVQQDMADLQTLNVKKTPEFFVNGRPLPSFGDQELLKLVREELEKTSKGG
ncbi:DsbA family protein [Noviherbaspirillum sp. ST9]|uniref:DsbA family protein n=1 Tax=Noviherbaspirillum sp. ST9 TaxID=3401606 RepID=UPI003B587C1B